MRTLILLTMLLFSTGISATAQEAVFVIRHAEKATDGADPDITEAGRNRAAAWARLLSDARLDLVITSDAKRTRATGGIIAETLGLPTDSLPVSDIAGLVDRLEFDHAEDRVLVVGHTETIPGMLELLGATDDITIDQSDYGNLFVLVPGGTDGRHLVHLHMP